MNGSPSEDFTTPGPQRFTRQTVARDVGEILVVEDDVELAEQTCQALEDAGFVTRHAKSVATAQRELEDRPPDLLILDRLLPDGDGLSYLTNLKLAGFNRPSLVLSALGETSQRVQGLNEGADDYLAKPFDFGELIARVTALLRRTSSPVNHHTVGDLQLDLMARTAKRRGISLHLQPREFALLAFLVENAGNVVTKKMLLKNVWNLDFDPQTNVVEAHMSRLRAKVDRGAEYPLLHTKRGHGYCLKAQDADSQH